jgi:hypothetical protein
MNFESIRLRLINVFCFCTLFGGFEKKIISANEISANEISANEYIKWKRRNRTDYQIYEITGYHY